MAMEKAQLLTELGISENSLRRWCKALDSTFGQSFTDEQVKQFRQLKELLATRKNFDDAIAELTGKRPEPKQAPGRYSNLPAQLQPKTVATAMVQQFDQQVMEEFFKLLQQPLSKQQIDQYFQSADADVIDGYLLESVYEE